MIDMDKITYIVGLDLGQVNDYTALAVLERTRPTERTGHVESFRDIHNGQEVNTVPVGEPTVKKKKTYAVRHLERFPLGTSYPAICHRLVDLFSRPPLSDATIAVDQTGVGRAVLDMIRQERPQA